MLSLFFWIMVFTILYTYIGYGAVLYLLVKMKSFFGYEVQQISNQNELPRITYVVAAFNEEEVINEKILNTKSIDYPEEKIQFIIMTDGSDDDTFEKASSFEGVEVYHDPNRNGKVAAMNRSIQFAKNDILIFSDANAMLNKDSFKEIVKHYANEKVGCVAGEKRIHVPSESDASSAGEGFYWKYESFLKKLDYQLYSAVGAAGELFSIRKELFNNVDTDVILDDFVISLKTVIKGYKIAYESNAFAVEGSSASISEEKKRKVRISAGGIQGILMLLPLLNIFKYPLVSFQYISHRVLRWTVTPLFLFMLPVVILLLLYNGVTNNFILLALFGQIAFYSLAFLGFLKRNELVKAKVFFIPYYFLFMNYCVILGVLKFIRGNQSVAWERVLRSDQVVSI